MKYYVCIALFVLLNITIRSEAQNIEVESEGLFIRLADLGDAVLQNMTYKKDSFFVVVYPTAGYSRRTGVEMGVMPLLGWRSNKTGGRLNTVGLLMQVSSLSMVELRGEGELFFSEKWRWMIGAEYLKINDRFWGVYSQSEMYDSWSYQSQRVRGVSELYRSLGGSCYAGAGVLIGHWGSSNWEFQPDVSMRGVSGGISMGVGPSFLMDTRDSHIYAKRGDYLKTSYKVYPQVWSGNGDFSNLMIDYRRFVSLGENVLALQGVVDVSSGDVPYYLLSELGGKYRLRGLDHTRRIVDKSVWMVRGEMRRSVWWRIGAVAFAEMGGAGSRFLSDSGSPVLSVGGGLRLRILPDELLNVRLDGAVATGGFYGIFLSLKEVF